MLFLNFKKWNSSHGMVFSQNRWYYKGSLTPFVKLQLRYWSLG